MSKKEWLAIFDMDGTLYDTLPANCAAYAAALAPYGVMLDAATYTRVCEGRHYRDFLPALLGGQCSAETLAAVHDEKTRRYPEMLHLVGENAPLFAQIDALRNCFHLAVVTTASRQNCMAVLAHFGRENTFDLLLCGDEVEKPKPHPMGYHMAMAHFGVNAAHTVIYEDSEKGMQAALAATPNVYRCYAYLQSCDNPGKEEK